MYYYYLFLEIEVQSNRGMTESTETENMHTCNVFVCVGACGHGGGCGWCVGGNVDVCVDGVWVDVVFR